MFGETVANFSQAGATTIICCRDQDKLDEACKQATTKGYSFNAYLADIADIMDCNCFVKKLNQDDDGIDLLINDAGHSIM